MALFYYCISYCRKIIAWIVLSLPRSFCSYQLLLHLLGNLALLLIDGILIHASADAG